MITDAVFSTRYDLERYNCLHFVCDMMKAGFGREMSYDTIMSGIRGDRSTRRMFELLEKPQEGCLCLFDFVVGDESHVGLFYNGNVLHITERGVRHQPVFEVLLGYSGVKYYAYRHNN